MYRESLLSSTRQCGFTLVEVIVTLVILSVMASVAIPYAELSIKRDHEYELRRGLRDVRSAIDRFHQDWRAGSFEQYSSAASEDGYPRALSVLVDGVDAKGEENKKHYYLRRIPNNPFVDPTLPHTEHWRFRGYQDTPDALFWGGEDVYDIKPKTEKMAIDGTPYNSW